MSKIIKASDFTNSALPTLKQDPAIRPSTLWCYDVLDPTSWPSQGAASDGNSIVNLTGGSAATVEGALAWSSGLEINPGSLTEHIKLPTSSLLASNVASFGATLWAKFASFTATRGLIGIGAIGGGGFGATQWGLFVNGSSQIRAAFNGSSTVLDALAVSTGAVHQLGVTLELVAGNYICKMWIDGVLISQGEVAGPMVATTTATEAQIGHIESVLTGHTFTFYRSMGDTLSGRTPKDFIEQDWAAGNGRFS